MWKKIKDETNYSINKNGEIREDSTGRIIQSWVNTQNQYRYVKLDKFHPIHRLLAEAFIPNPENKPLIDHIDHNRQNNSLDNLRWVTYSENNMGTRSEPIRVTHYPEIRNKRGGGHIEWLEPDNVMYFDKIGDAAAYFDCNQSNLTPMLKSNKIGERGKMRGYRFEYMKV